jgi:hypothetical protein
VQIFFLALFEEKLNKLLDQPTISWISGMTIWYPAFFDIRYPAGYQIGQPDIRPDIR